MNTPKLEDLTNYISTNLDISNKYLSSIIGLSPVSISSQKQNYIRDISKNKVARRVGNLYFVVHSFVNKGIAPNIILECILNPCFSDIKNKTDSVSSSIQQDKYPVEVLIHISNIAYNEKLSKLKYQDNIFNSLKFLT